MDDLENINPNIALEGGVVKKRGRPPGTTRVDYYQKYEAERKKVERLQKKIKALLVQPSIKIAEMANKIKQQRKSYKRLKKRNLELKRKIKALNSGNQKGYKELGATRRRQVRREILQKISGHSAAISDEAHLRTFLVDMLKTRNKELFVERWGHLLEAKELTERIQKYVITPRIKSASKDMLSRARAYVHRKTAKIGRNKMLAQQKSLNLLTISLSSKIIVKRPQIKCNSKVDAQCKSFLRDSFPGELPVPQQDPTIKKEHAFFDVEEHLKIILTFLLTTKKLSNHLVWFWDPMQGAPKVNHFELSTFYDGLPLFGGKSTLTQLSFRILNLPSLIQRPQFLYPNFLVEAKECSPEATKLLRQCSHQLMELLNKGMVLEFRDFADTDMIPKTNIPLNGVHKVTFGTQNLWASDGKAFLFANGCLGANQRFLPLFDLHSENFVDPDFPLTLERFVTFEARLKSFEKVQDFRELQRQKFCQQAQTLAQQGKGDEVRRKTEALYNRLMCKEVLDFAAEARTGCVHIAPFEIAEWYMPCGLHMECNEYQVVLTYIMDNIAELTLELKLAKEFPSTNSNTSTATKTARMLPNLTSAALNSPLVLALKHLDDGNLPQVAEYFREFYTPPAGDADSFESILLGDMNDGVHKVQSSGQKKPPRRLRLLGQHVFQLAKVFPSLCDQLQSPVECDEMLSQRIVSTRTKCKAYVHLLRTTTSSYGQWLYEVGVDDAGASFLGTMFVGLVHRFALHKSFNTFLLAQVTPFMLKSISAKYCFSPTLSLGASPCGRNEGGELTNQMLKQCQRYCTSGRSGWSSDLLNQSMDINICGTALDLVEVPADVNLEANYSAKHSWSQRFGSLKADMCHMCVSAPAQHSLKDQLDNLFEPLWDSHKMDLELCGNSFEGITWKILFSRFVLADFEGLACQDCARVLMLLVAVLLGKEAELSFMFYP